MTGEQSDGVLEPPLGDANEVYDIKIEAETDYRIEGSATISRVDDENSVWFIDEIHGGKVALQALCQQEDTEAGTLGSLSAESARKLGTALIRSAEYAERQSDSRPNSEEIADE